MHPMPWTRFPVFPDRRRAICTRLSCLARYSVPSGFVQVRFWWVHAPDAPQLGEVHVEVRQLGRLGDFCIEHTLVEGRLQHQCVFFDANAPLGLPEIKFGSGVRIFQPERPMSPELVLGCLCRQLKHLICLSKLFLFSVGWFLSAEPFRMSQIPQRLGAWAILPEG